MALCTHYMNIHCMHYFVIPIKEANITHNTKYQGRCSPTTNYLCTSSSSMPFCCHYCYLSIFYTVVTTSHVQDMISFPVSVHQQKRYQQQQRNTSSQLSKSPQNQNFQNYLIIIVISFYIKCSVMY